MVSFQPQLPGSVDGVDCSPLPLVLEFHRLHQQKASEQLGDYHVNRLLAQDAGHSSPHGSNLRLLC